MSGESLDSERPRRSTFLSALVAIGLGLAALALAKYAVDLLVMLLAVLVAIFVLHEVMQALARSDLFSPGSLLAIALLVGLGVWLLVPNNVLKGIEQRMPAPVARFLEWSQSHGWGYTVAAPGPASESGSGSSVTGSATPVSSGPASDPLTLPAAGPSAVVVSASQPSTVLGAPAVFMARLTTGEATRDAGDVTVRFYDGSLLLGTATIRQEGQARVAYLTVTTLSVGSHEIAAEIVGGTGLASGRSALMRHTVVPRTGR